MVTNNYKNAYKEVYIILSYLEDDNYNKIPEEVINAIKANMNEEYEYEMNEEVDIYKQEMLSETKATLFNIFRDYLATPEQKEKIIKMQSEDRKKAEMKKKEKYKTDNLFNNRKDKESLLSDKKNNIKLENTELIEIKEKTILQKILQKIKIVLFKK